MRSNLYCPAARSAAAKACILFAAVSALWPSSVQAQCPQGWDVSNRWRIKQGPTDVDLNLRQNGTPITGTASYYGMTKRAKGGLFAAPGEEGTIKGTVEGTIVGDQLQLHVHWSNNNTTGVYDGTIRPNGAIGGTVYDKAKPAKKETWSSDRAIPCAPSPAIARPSPTPQAHHRHPLDPSATPRLLMIPN